MPKKQITIAPLSKEDEERFWSKVRRDGANGCWHWLGATVGPGYGKFKLNGRSCYAHRVSYALLRDNSSEIYVVNRCGNLACVNPDHLAAQSRTESIEAAGRQAQLRRRTNFRKKMGLHPDFPLFPLGDPKKPESQRWAKKVRGRLRYFGKVSDDPKGVKALDRWNEQRDDLLAGREPRDADAVTLGDVCNRFLTAKRNHVDSSKMSPRMFVQYRETCDLLIDTFGRNRLVIDLRPVDFEGLHAKLAKRHGLVTLGRAVTTVRSVFKYAVEAEIIDRAVRFGPEFKPPSKVERRKHRAKQTRLHGAKTFTAYEIRQMLDAAGPQLKCMLLLGCNAGFGNTDCATLPLSALDLTRGWLDHPRPKSGVERRVPLWKETVKALKAVIAKRPQPRSPEFANLVFLTRLGQPWVRYELVESLGEDGKAQVTGRADDAIANCEPSKRCCTVIGGTRAPIRAISIARKRWRRRWSGSTRPKAYTSA